MSPTAKMSGSLVRSACVDEHAVVDVEPGRLGELGAGPDADADHDRVGGELARRRPAVRRSPSISAILRAQPQVDAVLAVQVGEDLAHLGAEDAEQRQLGRLDDA